MANYSAVIWAAGCYNLTEKLGGKSVLSHSIDPFDDDGSCVEILLLVDEATHNWIKSDPLTFVSTKQRVLPLKESGLADLLAAIEQAQGEIVLINDASRPNFGELVQSVLKHANQQTACAPYLSLDMLGSPAQLSDEQKDKPVVDSIFGPAQTQSVRKVTSAINATQMSLLQTPQAFPREVLLNALKAQGDRLSECKPGSYTMLYLANDGEMIAVPGMAGNINLVDEESQRLLLKLMGGQSRKKKDRYGGLGW